MVVFTCNHCGETLHKPKVEKHYQFQCRNFKSVTCVDCFKDFRNEEYVVHTKCITEDERYAAKGTYKNGIVKKGDVKQESWLEMIKSICDSEKDLKPSLRSLLNTISEYSNVPRKKIKFINFIKSSSGGRANMNDVEQVWNIIEKYKADRVKEHSSNKNIEQNSLQNKNGKSDSQNHENDVYNSTDQSSTNKKRRGIEENGENKKKKVRGEPNLVVPEELTSSKENENGQITEELVKTLSFNFKEKILEILTAKGSISHKKLQKKVVKAYLAFTGLSESNEKILKKFNKKLSKIGNVKVEDDKVVLVTEKKE